MTNNLIYWLNQGVDGFRFDAVTHLVENGRLRSELYDQPETVEIMKRFSSQIRSYNNKFTVGEQSARESYLGNGSDLLHSTFAWGFAHAVIDAVNTGTACPSAYGSLDQVLRNTVLENIPSAVRRSTLLSNHDTIVGDRPMTRFNGDDAKAGLAATCYLLSPGVPFIYYGEEIGMKKYTESAVPDNDYALRTPMQWEDGTHAGFTTAAQPWRKINSNYTVYNVSDESSDPGSILNHYRKLTSIRNQSPALGDGGYRLLTINSQIWAFERSLGNEKVMVVINLSANPSSVSLNLTGVAPSGTVRSPGADLYDPSVIHPSLTDSNRTSYPVSVPARGVRIIRFQN
jgi:glycosidase